MAAEQFHRLAQEKQDRILDAASNEFARYGYDYGSTNRIVDNAGISKGVLFKYFKNKEQLFLYICERKSIEKKAWMSGAYDLPDDLFDILREYTIREMAFYRDHPSFFMITQQMKARPEHPVHNKALETMRVQSEAIAANLFSNLPSHSLKDDITIQEALTFTNWVFEGFNKTVDDDIRSSSWAEDVLQKVERVFKLIKYGVYKNGCD